MKRKLFALVVVLGAVTFSAGAWDYEGHHAINELALASLPRDFGGFELTPALKGRIEYLAGEPDRWRNVGDLPLKNVNGPDHYIDLEDVKLFDLTPETLPLMRYDFMADIAKVRAAHPEKFPPIDPDKDADHTRELDGFLPWAITENYEKLKSDFSSLKAFRQFGGTPEEIANAQADCIYVMGVMGHYVGDGAQPLHTTDHHNGWVGPNPNGYSTWKGLHAWIDGGFLGKAGIKLDDLAPRIRPATGIPLNQRADGRDPMFVAVFDYLLGNFKLVEPLYQMEKAGKFSDQLEQAGKFHQDTQPVNAEGRAFIEGQLVKGGEMLGSIWLTAWKQAVPDTYLRSQLVKRQAGVK